MTAAWLDIVLVVLKVDVRVLVKVGRKACTAAAMMVVQMAAMKDFLMGAITVALKDCAQVVQKESETVGVMEVRLIAVTVMM